MEDGYCLQKSLHVMSKLDKIVKLYTHKTYRT